MTELKRELGLLDATMINVGTIIASAIFIVPSAIAGELPASALVLLVWIVGGLVSLLGALCVAELGAAFPRAGGQFVFLREAYGPVWGYLYGWASAVVINPASIAAIAVAFATYLGFFLPLDSHAIKGVAILSIALLTGINCLGVRTGARTQNGLTLLKIGLVALLILLGFALPGGRAANFTPVWPRQPFATLISPFGVAMVAALWAYDGWIEITYVGGEVKEPERNLPRSIIASTVLAIVLYSLITMSFVYVLPHARLASSPLVASAAARVTMGQAGATLVAVAILISTFGANNGIVLTAARIPYAMARDGLLFRWAAGVHPRFLTPVPALVAQGIVASVLALSGTYDELFTYVIFTSWVFYAMSCGAVIRLRHKAPALPRPYRAWGYPVTPVVFIAFATWLVANTIVAAPRDAAVGAGIVLAGLPGYFYWKRYG